MMISTVLIMKILVSTLIVVSLSIIAEKVSPMISGILSGYPLGTAMALFFYGLEISPEFASQSAIYTLVGLIASQTFVYVYYWVSLRVTRFSPLISSFASIAAFLGVSFIFSQCDLSKYTILFLTLVSVALFIFFFRELPDVKIETAVKIGFYSIFMRALMATGIIVVITSLPEILGERWAGFFSGFPITLFPLILIIHIRYQTAHVHTIIKNFPQGIGALILYSVSVYILYPLLDIYMGTLVSFVGATGYLLVVLNLKREPIRDGLKQG